MALLASSDRRLQATSSVSSCVWKVESASAIASPPRSDTSLPLRRSVRSEPPPRRACARPCSLPGPMLLPLRLRLCKRRGRPASGERRAERCAPKSSDGPAPKPFDERSREVRCAQPERERKTRPWSSSLPRPIMLLPMRRVKRKAADPETAAAPAAPALQVQMSRDSSVVFLARPLARNWAPTTPMGLALRSRCRRRVLVVRASAMSSVDVKDMPTLDARSSARAVLSRRIRARRAPPASITRQLAILSSLTRDSMPSLWVRQRN
mmetsp:Transcript_12796/g.32944  ORF Transcript_12796/g.32944 Transcript_12796/m.32944 type:complete len:266 (-) Transcript_12796:125-922(-)